MPDTAAKSAGGFPSHAVAVVGLAGRFPDAPTLDRFWENIRDGVESLATYSPQELLDERIKAAVSVQTALLNGHLGGRAS